MKINLSIMNYVKRSVKKIFNNHEGGCQNENNKVKKLEQKKLYFINKKAQSAGNL